jgi:hypothetical protein
MYSSYTQLHRQQHVGVRNCLSIFPLPSSSDAKCLPEQLQAFVGALLASTFERFQQLKQLKWLQRLKITKL